jgi:MHS family proline/betaine transporter-like MFS transporter
MKKRFDFACFGAFADIIGSQFFPYDDSNLQLMKSLALFGAAFVMRPLGTFSFLFYFIYFKLFV